MPTERVTRGSRGGASKESKGPSSRSSDRNRSKPTGASSTRDKPRESSRSKPSESVKKPSTRTSTKPSDRTRRDADQKESQEERKKKTEASSTRTSSRDTKDKSRSQVKSDPSRGEGRERNRTDTKDRTRSDRKDRTKSDPKDRTRTDPKDRTRSDPKDRTKSDPKDRSRTDAKDRTRSDTKDRTRSDPKEKSRTDPKDRTRSEAKERSRTDPKERSRSDRNKSNPKEAQKNDKNDRRRSDRSSVESSRDKPRTSTKSESKPSRTRNTEKESRSENREKSRDKPKERERGRTRDKDDRTSKGEKDRKEERLKSSMEKNRTQRESIDPEIYEAQPPSIHELSDSRVLENNMANISALKDLETIENQNSLESGISITSPRNLSSEEVDVEESFSSRLVEVDEIEEEEDIIEEDSAHISNSQPPSMGLQEQSKSYIEDSMIPDYGTMQFEDPDTWLDSDNDHNFDYESMAGVPPISSHQETKSLDPSEAVSSQMPQYQVVETTEQVEEAEEAEDDYDYEDDFEDYDDDFEDDSDESTTQTSSSSEESSSSSSDSDTSTDLESQEDDGMEDAIFPLTKTIPSTVIPPKITPPIITAPTIASSPKPRTSFNIVNFQKAKQQQTNNQVSSKIKTRGQTILSMIELDEVQIELFSQEATPYDQFISHYGRSNRTQVSVQTESDSLTEDTQTEQVTYTNKWTQNPPRVQNTNNLPSEADYLGVGGDDLNEKTFRDNYETDSIRLSKFLSSSAQVMLRLLEETDLEKYSDERKSSSNEEFGFVDPGIPLGKGVEEFFTDRLCTALRFCPSDPMILVTGHSSVIKYETDDLEETPNSSYSSSLLFVWAVQEPSQPKYILSSSATPTCITFSPGKWSIIVAGLEDGTLGLWDLRENSAFHQYIDDESSWKIRAPSFITACSDDNFDDGHKIVEVHTLSNANAEDTSKRATFQVVSLSANGRLTWWTVIQVPVILEGENPSMSARLGAAPWSRLELSKGACVFVSQQLYRQDNLKIGDDTLDKSISCYDLQLSEREVNQLYVGTANGTVAHCSRHNIKLYPVSYLPDIDAMSEILSISVSPHDSKYFLAGGSDGLIRLHTFNSPRPLTTWQTTPDLTPIFKIQWSPTRPSVFYVLDANGRLHIWDLRGSDLFPAISVDPGGLLPDGILNFSLSYSKTEVRQHYICLTNGASVELRRFSNKFVSRTEEDLIDELEKFNYYVSII